MHLAAWRQVRSTLSPDQRKLGKPQILCLGLLLVTPFHGFSRAFESAYRRVKHVEQKAFDGGVSHRGFPGCVECSPVTYFHAFHSRRGEKSAPDSVSSAPTHARRFELVRGGRRVTATHIMEEGVGESRRTSSECGRRPLRTH